MENIPRNLEKEIAKLTLPKPARKVRRWTLLLVGDHGKTISVGSFKAVAIAGASLLAIAVVCAVSFYFLYRSSYKANARLNNSLAVLQKQVSSLRDERDILMARLVLESKTDAKQAKKIEKQPEKPMEPPPKAMAAETGPNAAKAEKKDVSAQQKEIEKKPAMAAPVQSKTVQRVTVEDFVVVYEPKSNTYRAQFKLRNTGSESEPVSGHTVVLLKNSEATHDNWLTLPSVELVAGKPSGERGQSFSISRFKTVKFKVTSENNPEQFKSATLFVYDTTGALLLEKSFSVEVKSNMSLPSTD